MKGPKYIQRKYLCWMGFHFWALGVNKHLNLKMYISGCVIERPKPILQKKVLPVLEKRPYSSELPELNDFRSLSTNKPILSNLKKEAVRAVSQNKILKPKKETSGKELHSLNEANQLLEYPRKDKTNEIKKKSGKLSLCTPLQSMVDRQLEFKLGCYFRYYPLIIVTQSGARQNFMKSLSEKGDLLTYVPGKKKLAKRNTGQISLKLLKVAQLKGKYKYREKFNYTYSAQLKALNYKRKETKKKRESSSSSSDDDNEKREKCRDLETWKKSMGVENSKVFVIKGRYKDLREALLERGWVQNEDKYSTFYDLKWTTKVNDVNFDSLLPNQTVNHFNNNACLTSKYGLCKSLRSIMYTEDIDVDKFFPKAYDLCDLSDFQNFLEVYKWVFCQSILKKFTEDMSDSHSLALTKVALMVTERRVLELQKNILSTINGAYCVCSINEWLFLSGQKAELDLIEKAIAQWDFKNANSQLLFLRVKEVLQILKKTDPQFDLNSSGNIWIVKPAFLSRGRGIKCIADFSDILDYSLGKQTQYVVQKYIENPLIINHRKFDIRQWVIVEDYNPPKIWVYGEFYVRFCLQDYNPAKLSNKFSHLTNNSIQKHNSKVNAAELMNQSMWTQEQLKEFVEKSYGEGSFQRILDKMKEVVVATIISTQDQVYGRRNSFQLIGYDFMIDSSLNPWLIEINSSPSMDYSTPVTRRLVKMVLEDTVKVVIDLKKKKSKKKNAGLFKCVYNGQTSFAFKEYSLEQ